MIIFLHPSQVLQCIPNFPILRFRAIHEMLLKSLHAPNFRTASRSPKGGSLISPSPLRLTPSKSRATAERTTSREMIAEILDIWTAVEQFLE